MMMMMVMMMMMMIESGIINGNVICELLIISKRSGKDEFQNKLN
jgi:hypothetical protein